MLAGLPDRDLDLDTDLDLDGDLDLLLDEDREVTLERDLTLQQSEINGRTVLFLMYLPVGIRV